MQLFVRKLPLPAVYHADGDLIYFAPGLSAPDIEKNVTGTEKHPGTG